MSLGLLGGYGSDSSTGPQISDSEDSEHSSHQPTPPPISTESGPNPDCPAAGDHEESSSGEGGGVDRQVKCQTSARYSNTGGDERKDGSNISGGYYGLSGRFVDSDPDLESDSDTGSLLSSADEGDKDQKCQSDHSPLPLPDLERTDGLTSSVFSNPFREAEEARLAVLKQHVDLSQQQEESAKDHKRRWRQKGTRTRRSEVSELSGETDDQWRGDSRPVRGRKYRSGVTETLVPPKKYRKIYQKIQSVERPWTSS